MRYRAGILSVAVAALVAVPALAEEIIYFTNGSSLAIRGHKVTEGMIHVDMGEDAFIGFPMSMVERIEEAGKDVYVPPSSKLGLKKNQMIEGATTSDAPRRVTGSYMRDPDANRDFRDKKGGADRVEVDANGMAFVRAYPNHRSPNRAQMQVTGRVGMGQVNMDPSKGLVGTRRLGTSQLLGEITPDQSKGGVILVRPSLAPDKPSGKPAAPAEAQAPGDASQGGGEDAEQGDPSGAE